MAEIVCTGLIFNKGIGQHILKNPLVITSMVDKVPYYCVLILILSSIDHKR